jgi:transcriptional regulator with XRE-family HTH domain
MVNTQYLEEIIKNSGLKISYIAEKCGMSRPTFNAKRNNESEFTAKEIKTLCDILGITSLTQREKIFFN